MITLTVVAFLLTGIPPRLTAVARAHLNGAPRIADIAGVVVGVSTERDAERVLGAALHCVGNHGRSEREWRTRRGCYIDLDGFSYDITGRWLIVQDATISCHPDSDMPRRAPYVRCGQDALGWLGSIMPGETVGKARAHWRADGLNARPHAGGWLVTAPGHVTVHRQDQVDGTAFTRWSARVTLRHGRVSSIYATCD